MQFYETDAAGIVHFSWFFRYMEEAEHALWREAGLSIHPPGSEIGWPRVAAAFDYHQSLRFEDEFEVRLRIEAIAKKTIKYACEIVRDESTIASGTLTIVCVRRRPNEQVKATDIPADIVERLGGTNR